MKLTAMPLDTTTHNERELPPVESGTGALVHPMADRQMAPARALLSTVNDPSRARQEWHDHGITLLPLGSLFSAVRLPQRLVLSVVGGSGPSAEVDGALNAALAGGPVICDPRGRRYYALVPASMPTTWRKTVDDWRVRDVDCLGHDTYLGVPRIDLTACDGHGFASYWSVPVQSMARLCAPLAVARFVAAGRYRLAEMEAVDECGRS